VAAVPIASHKKKKSEERRQLEKFSCSIEDNNKMDYKFWHTKFLSLNSRKGIFHCLYKDYRKKV
jgi:hypothetical protein